MRTLIYTICLLFFATPLWAQYEAPREKKVSLEEKARRGDKLKGYRISPNTGIPEQVNILDTVAYQSHNYLAPERRSLAVSYAGNANHPWQSKIFFDRVAKLQDFVYLSGYQSMLYSPENSLFYTTKTPFTFVKYRKNFADNVLEEVLDGTISTNLGKRINIGVSGNHASAEGYYTNNKSRNINYRVFGSYNSDRYDLWAYFANDYYKQLENGGISDLSYIENIDQHSNGRVELGSLDIPVNITPFLYNQIRNGHGYLSHRYKLGSYRRVEGVYAKPKESKKPIDNATSLSQTKPIGIDASEVETQQDSMVFVPVGSVSHQVYYNKSSRVLYAREHSDLWSTLYGTPLVNSTIDNSSGTPVVSVVPNDYADYKVLKNTLSLSLIEGFRPWVKAGLSAYLRTENYWLSSIDETTKSRPMTDKFYSVFAGGELARRSGKGLNFSARGEVGILGKDLGALTLEGDVNTKFRFMGKDFGLKLDARLLNYRPSYFAAHHHGTWSWWDEDFSFSRRIELGAKADFSSFGTWVELRTASLQNQIYWASDATAKQSSELVQMNMLRAGHRYQVGPLGWALEGAYQLSTKEDIVPVPALAVRGDIYFDFMIAKVLQVQLGAEAYWHSAYYTPTYHPAVMQFVNQEEAKIGGKSPLVNAYANFRMRTTRFYARMYNVGEALFSPSRQTMNKYVYNPMHLEVGLAIDLKN